MSLRDLNRTLPFRYQRKCHGEERAQAAGAFLQFVPAFKMADVRFSGKSISEEILTGIASPLVAVLWLRPFIPHFAGAIYVAFRICASLPDTLCWIGLRFRVRGTSGGRCL
jgi:hypothetical protein